MSETYVQLTLREFRKMKALADRAIAQVSTEQFTAALGDGDNSIAVIVKHVGGNLASRWTDFLTTDGEKPGRNRDTEFQLTATDSHESILALWEKGWASLFHALEPLTDFDLQRTVRIRGEPLTVLQAINRQLTHYSYHVGQIVYVAKHLRGREWQSLSIPVGKSAEFNRSPDRYIAPASPGA